MTDIFPWWEKIKGSGRTAMGEFPSDEINPLFPNWEAGRRLGSNIYNTSNNIGENISMPVRSFFSDENTSADYMQMIILTGFILYYGVYKSVFDTNTKVIDKVIFLVVGIFFAYVICPMNKNCSYDYFYYLLIFVPIIASIRSSHAVVLTSFFMFGVVYWMIQQCSNYFNGDKNECAVRIIDTIYFRYPMLIIIAMIGGFLHS